MVMATEYPFYRFAQVLQQMPAIGDLHCLRGPLGSPPLHRH
jgi:hypothetical protein